MKMVLEKADKVTKSVNSAIEYYGDKADELIPILIRVNRELGYLPNEALEEISHRLGIPESQLMAVASFYYMLYTKPMGRHVIKFCESAPCHVAGGREVWSSLKDNLKLDSGETSPDGKWTLITTSCLGICAVGPVLMIDENIHGNITPDQIPEILSRYP